MVNNAAAEGREPSPGPASSPAEWERFGERLALALASLAVDQVLVVSAKRGGAYVQFLRARGDAGASRLRCEAVSNEYLPDEHRLGEEQLRELAALGWNAPTHGAKGRRVRGGSPNFHRVFEEPFRCEAIAGLAVRTLADVLDVREPQDLEYRSFQQPGGRAVLLPILGVDRARRAPPKRPRKPSLREVQAAVLRAIRSAAHNEKLDYDDDGDLRVTYGDAVLFVSVRDGARFVRVLSVVASELAVGEELLRRVDEYNRRSKLVRFLTARSAVLAVTDVFTEPLVPEHVVHACHVVGDLTNQLRDPLLAEFGAGAPQTTACALKN
jgi:hypothetical protein